MVEKEKMIVAALRFRATKLWDILDDSMIFAVCLPDGEIGYCCVMGNAGEHYALGLYRGAKGFSTYLKLISTPRMDMKEIFEIMQTYDCINCDFVNASDAELDKVQKEGIKEVAAANGLKISRPMGWPVFIRMNGAHSSIGLYNDKDCEDITAALEAATYVAKTIKKKNPLDALGFDPGRNYADERGGKEIPFLTAMGNGAYEWSLTKTPAFIPDEYPELKYDNLFSSARIKSIPHDGICQCRLIHLHAKVGSPEEFYNPKMLLFVNTANEMVYPVMSQDESQTTDRQLVDGLAQFFLRQEVCPATIQVPDRRTERMLSDFCKKTGISLNRKNNLHQLNNVWDYLIASMSSGAYS